MLHAFRGVFGVSGALLVALAPMVQLASPMFRVQTLPLK